MHQEGDGCQLHFVGLNPFAQKFRCPAHHQADQEHCQDDEHDEVDEPHTLAAKDHVEHHLRKGCNAGQRCKTIVHSIDGAGGKGGRRGHKERSLSLAEPQFLALHIALGGIDSNPGQERIPLNLADIGDRQKDQEEGGHYAEEHPGLFLSA